MARRAPEMQSTAHLFGNGCYLGDMFQTYDTLTAVTTQVATSVFANVAELYKLLVRQLDEG